MKKCLIFPIRQLWDGFQHIFIGLLYRCRLRQYCNNRIRKEERESNKWKRYLADRTLAAASEARGRARRPGGWCCEAARMPAGRCRAPLPPLSTHTESHIILSLITCVLLYTFFCMNKSTIEGASICLFNLFHT